MRQSTKQRFYVTFKNGDKLYEVFEIDFYDDQVVINSSIAVLRDFHTTQHQPSGNKNIGWHVKDNKSGLMVLENRSQGVGDEFKEIGFFHFKNHLITQCKLFKREFGERVDLVKIDDTDKQNLSFFFFRSSIAGLKEGLSKIDESHIRNLDTPGTQTSTNDAVDYSIFYFESHNNISVGVVLLKYNSTDIKFLNLTNIVKNTVPIYKYLRIYADGTYKEEVACAEFEGVLFFSNDTNPFPCGGVVVDF
jgi:hypothetical protein